MNNSCEFAGEKYCMCNACQSMRKTLEEAVIIPKEEIETLFAKLELPVGQMKKE